MSNEHAVKEAIEQAQKLPETMEQAVARLAAMPSLEYEKVRKAEAESLGIDRISALDDEVLKYRKLTAPTKGEGELFATVQPWDEAIDAEKLLNDIQALVRRYIVCNPETAIAATLWITFTWFIENVQVAPIAMITAPEKRCGKSQLLTLIGNLSNRPLQASNISPAAIFRVIEAYSPTLLIDEADTFMKENEEIRCVINSGHTRQSAQVIRLVGDTHDPKTFSTWGAKAISGIGSLPDTIMDRSVILELRRKLPHETVQRLRHADPSIFELYKSQLARLALDAGEAMGRSRPALPEELNDRAQDNWEPLLAIADYAGGDWPRRARDAALKISGKEQDALSLSAELLADIKEVFETKNVERISTVDLLSELNGDDMKPWGTYNRGKPMSPRQLARRLAEYGIKPQTIRIHGTVKGFLKSWFEDAFMRYLTPSAPDTPLTSVTPSQSASNPEPEPLSDVTDTNPCYGNISQSVTPKAAENLDCYSVTDTQGGYRDVEVF